MYARMVRLSRTDLFFPAAHTVIIKGVKIFQNNANREYSDLDIMQMLGRAVSDRSHSLSLETRLTLTYNRDGLSSVGLFSIRTVVTDIGGTQTRKVSLS